MTASTTLNASVLIAGELIAHPITLAQSAGGAAELVRDFPLPDCCVLDVAVASQGALVTFDTRLAVAAQVHGVPVAVA